MIDLHTALPRRWLLLSALVVIALLGAFSPPRAGAAASAAVPALPGPPPGAGTGFPVAPAVGSTPGIDLVGPPISIPTSVPAPGLLNGAARIQGRVLGLAIACRTDGLASLQAAALGHGVIAHGTYKCHQRRANVQLTLSSGAAHLLAGLGSTVGQVKLGRGTATEAFPLTLAARSLATSVWSDGGLQCNLFGANSAYLVAPDFRVTPAVTIDFRPWIAFYTSANGWQWLGTGGLNRSSWYRATASPGGVRQWLTPAGALNPWTWALISVHPGRSTYAIGVFELIYWYAHTRYAWHYAMSQPSTGAGSTFCAYP